MRILFLKIASFLLFISFQSFAQKVKPRFKELSLISLEEFQEPPSNWKVIGAAQASYNDTNFNTAKGTGILFNDYSRSIQFQPGHHLITKMQHGDILLDFDFMIPKGSNSGIYLQSRYEIQINDRDVLRIDIIPHNVSSDSVLVFDTKLI